MTNLTEEELTAIAETRIVIEAAQKEINQAQQSLDEASLQLFKATEALDRASFPARGGYIGEI